MRLLAPLVTLLVIVTMFACSKAPESTANDTHSRVSKDNVFSEPVKALEKAEQVEGQIMDAFNKRNTSIDNQ